jgi:hypothetical protein
MAESDTRLLPCPFCGHGEPLLHANDWIAPPQWGLHCGNTECMAGMKECGTPEEAIAAWNRRTINADLLKAARRARAVIAATGGNTRQPGNVIDALDSAIAKATHP